MLGSPDGLPPASSANLSSNLATHHAQWRQGDTWARYPPPVFSPTALASDVSVEAHTEWFFDAAVGASARARIHSTSGLTIIAQDQCCSARNATRAAPAPLGPPCTTARTQRFSLSCRTSHAVSTAHGGLAERMAAFFSSSGFPP